MRIRLLTTLLVIAPATALAAQGADFGVGVTAGSLGLGLEADKLILGHIGIRGNVNFVSASFTHTESDVTFDAHLKFKGLAGFVDLYPSNRGSFHLTGGIISKPIEITATGVPSDGTYTINGNDYSAAEVGSLTGNLTYPKTSGYAGLGFGTPAAKHPGIAFIADFGVIFAKPTILLSSISTNSQLQSDLAAQQVTIQNDVNKFLKVYPVSTIGVMIRF